ncbi:SDR family oxidoreductase [Poriferisphaera sp. WC338]|uniref:SDR family oxidoreductase n=1 Tax=Poriferisphaera sp. WC338 TaxID=3425129 RepID=UPI003D812C7D
MKILVTGATGYVGGRLVPRLLERGHQVVVLVRDASRIEERAWADQVTVHVGDMLDEASLTRALAGAEVAYYLVHSMWGGKGFEDKDRIGAEGFIRAAHTAGKQSGVKLRHVVYLGGLQPSNNVQHDHLLKVSRHLRSRAEVGEILREGLPGCVTEFRAGPIIGSGSASFEMVRYLTERLPVMVAPKWIMNPVHPIGIRNVMEYLVYAMDRQSCGVIDIGVERMTFKQMMHGYAQVRGLKRLILPIPVLTPGLASHWVGLVTPIPNKLARPLIEGVIEPLVLQNNRAAEQFPQIKVMNYQEAVKRAIDRVEENHVETRWSGALGLNEDELQKVDVSEWEGMSKEVRSIHVQATSTEVFDVVSGLGGDTGWLVWEWAWWLRGVMDRVVGGPGLRRGRRDSKHVLPGEAIDFWRVEKVEESQLLRLRAEMKLPGKAWLQWEIKPAKQEDFGCELVQTAMFEPRGLPGTLYWYSLYPIHKFIFTDMVRAIAKRAVSGNSDIVSSG